MNFRPSKRLKKWEGSRTTKAAVGEKAVREAIERLSDFKLKLIPKGVGTEVGYIEGVDLKGQVADLDYEVQLNEQAIAYIDVTGSNWTFDGSQIMPVNYYKGDVMKKLSKPCFIVFSMEKEDKPIEDRCVWITGKDVVKCPHKFAYLGGKLQNNYYTDKNDWKRGLKGLVDALLTLSSTSD